MPDLVPLREMIAAAVFERLQAGLADATVRRSSRRAVAADKLSQPEVNVIGGGHTNDVPETGDTIYEMQVTVDMTVPAAADADLEPALNALYAATVQTLMADYTLGGLCSDLRERGFDVRLPAAEESAKPFIEGSLDLIAAFRTADGDPCSTY